jgi:predicted lipoprotein
MRLVGLVMKMKMKMMKQRRRLFGADHQGPTLSPWLASASLGFVLAAGCTSTTGDPEPDPAGDFDRVALVENLADTVMLPAMDSFVARAEALQTATTAWRAAALADVAASADERAAAQTAWLEARDAWQRVELMQIGPAASSASLLQGAEDLRDEIYSWPTENPCAVDQQLVANAFDGDGWFAARLITLKGLDAIEYVTFMEGDGNACANAASINQDGSWTALGSDGVVQRRAAYAAGASAYLVETARRLRAAWDGPAGYRAKLVLDDDAFYPTGADALNDVFAGLFYIELGVKDRKLAVPAGLHLDCADEACPDATEARWSRQARQNIVINLQTFKDLFTGGEGLGFDDYLDAVGASELKTSMADKTDAAIAGVEGLDGDLYTLVQSDRMAVVAAYELIKSLTDDLKSQFVTALNLRVPAQGAGDND